jgi:hypothetical protein
VGEDAVNFLFIADVVVLIIIALISFSRDNHLKTEASDPKIVVPIEFDPIHRTATGELVRIATFRVH